MEIISNYNKALQAIYDHVGFKEDWVICPIDDRTDMYWKVWKIKHILNQRNKITGIVYHQNKDDVINKTGNHYCDTLYTQRFYKKWVYRGKEYTMIFCDTNIDGMKYFALFDNKKELK